MALFKICRGNESNLPETLTDGYAYFCTDTGNFYIDWADAEANISRKHINAEYATKLRFKDENEEWVEIDPKNVVTEHVQADWDQTDPTSAAYIANRPFGYLPNLYEDTWTFPEDSAQNGVYRISGSYPFPDECALGETYDIVWNGVQYSCTYQSITLTKKDGSSKLGIPHLGNIQLLLDGLYTDWTADTVENDAPFVIIPTWRGSTTPGACHVVIRHDEANNYSKLDEKFLPDSAATKEFVEEKIAGISVEQVQVDWNETDPMSPSYIVNRPFGLLPNLYEDLNANFIVGSGTGDAFIQETKPSVDWNLIKTGNTYIVVWDGLQYTCEATMASYVYDDANGGGTISLVSLGNPKLLARYQGSMSTSSEDPYKPFLIALSGVYSEKSGSHSYYIQSEVNFKKLDIEYLPDGAATTEYVDNSIDGLANVAKTGAYQSLSDAPRFTRVAAGGTFNDLYGRPFGDLRVPMEEVSWTFTQHEDTGLASRTIRVTDESGFRTYPLPVVDAKYTVSWDGENYTCTAKQRPSGLVLGHEGDMYFGNIDYFYRVFGSVVPEEYKTAEPFCFYYMNGDIARADSNILVITDLSESSHTFSIVPQDDVKKIDIKYLPDDLATEQFVEDKIANIKVSGGGTVEQQIDVIPETEFAPFEQNAMFGEQYVHNFEWSESSFVPQIGASYTVVWDGVEYSCVAYDTSDTVAGSVSVGNGSMFGYSSNNEPFGLVFDEYGVTLVATDGSTEESHTVRVYQTKVSSTGGVSSWNDLTDKPFYDAEVVVFDGEFNAIKLDENTWDSTLFAPYNNEDPLVIGETYTFYWDGVAYTSECYSLMGVGCIGFNAMTGEGADRYPVAICADVNGSMTGTPSWMAATATPMTDMSHSGVFPCKIVGKETKKIDDKYQHQPDWDETDVNRASFVKNKPFGVLSKAGVLHESDVSYEANDFGFMLMDFASEDVIIGGNYKVSVNGVSYTGVCEGAGSLEDGAITYTHLVRLNADGQTTLGLVCNPTLVETGITIPAVLAPENITGDTRWTQGEVCHIVISAMDEIVATVPHKYLDFIEKHEDVVIPKMDVEFIYQGGESGAIISTTEDEILRVAKRNGEYINVEFDGVVYKSKIISGGNTICFGATGFLDGVSSMSEPFCIIAEPPLDSSDTTCQWIMVDIAGTVNGLETPYTKSIKVWFDGQATVKNEYLDFMELTSEDVDIISEMTANLTECTSTYEVHFEPNTTQYAQFSSINAGNSCIVLWEGAEYHCVAQDLSQYFEGEGAVARRFIALGNLSMVDSDDDIFDDTKEPFLIVQADVSLGNGSQNYLGVITPREDDLDSIARAFSVRKVDVASKIKPEYLPMMEKSDGIATITKRTTAITESFAIDSFGYTLYKLSDDVLTADQLFASDIKVTRSVGDSSYMFKPTASDVIIQSDSLLITNTKDSNNGLFAIGLCMCYQTGDTTVTVQGTTLPVNIPYTGTFVVYPTTSEILDMVVDIKYPVEAKWIIKEEYLPEIHAEPAEIPYFDLTAMGLPEIPLDGTWVTASYDMTELRDAAAKGVIKTTSRIAGLTMDTVSSLVYIREADIYSYTNVGTFGGTPVVIMINISANEVKAGCAPLTGGTTTTMTDVSQEGA